MKTLFSDTGYWVALLNPLDSLHEAAKEVSKAQGQFLTVTSEAVLAELLNYFAERGDLFRSAAATLVRTLQNDPNTVVVPATSMLFRLALQLYIERQDKGWSLTDCMSFCIMKERGISEALTPDHHYEQAGFIALIKQPTAKTRKPKKK